MLGGPVLSALGALRSGAGLAVLALPEPLVPHALTIAPTATALALPVDGAGDLRPSAVAELIDQYQSSWSCLAIGPGLGSDDTPQQIVLRLIAQEDVPLVIDADGLNCLAKLPDFPGDFHTQAVLTPHPGEYRRLATALGIDLDPSDPAARAEAADALAQRLGCVVVLKGPNTVVSDGLDAWTNDTGNVALATGGTGDVLTGVIAGFIAQFFKPHLGAGARQVTPQQQGGLGLFDCTRLAVRLCGRTADLWADEHGSAGLLATDLLDLLPRTIHEYRQSTESAASGSH